MPYCAPATFDGDFFSYTCAPGQYFWTIMLTSNGQTAPPSGIPRFTGRNGFATASSSSSFPASTSSSPHSNSKNVGAIAWSAVGGLAVLCLFILGLVFLILRYRRPLRVVSPAVASGGSTMFNPMSTPAELSSSVMRPVWSEGRGVELDGRP